MQRAYSILKYMFYSVKDSCYPRKDGEAVLSLEDNTVAIQDKMLTGPRRGNNIKSMPKLNGVRNSLNPDTWRTWSIQRAGFSDSVFEGTVDYFQC